MEKTASQHYDALEAIALIGVKSVLDVKEVAIYIRRSESRVRALVNNCEIPHYTKPGGRITFRKSEIDDWLLGKRVPTKDELQSQAATHCALNKSRGRRSA